MTTYTIEDGIPLVKRTRGNDAARPPTGPRSPLLKVVDQLKPGQSLLMTDHKEVRAAEAFQYRHPERQFAVRKVPAVGWRIWRTQ